VKGLNSPTVWAIHAISPSTYDQKRFKKLVDGLLKNNIGVICCPSAALSMRQLRPVKTPTHNSMARIMDMLEAGVEVQIGTDNICDVFVPSSDGCMLTEIKILSNTIRFYIINVLAKLAAGKKLNEMDKEMIRRSLIADQEYFRMYKLEGQTLL
jgi:cytosine/adenosine deaminase-related metal-dependent hydrolase